MKVLLFQPQIPQNTGNVGRLCVATNTPLILVRPLGFFIDSKEIRRSGLDYWEHLELTVVDNLKEVQDQNPQSRFWYFSKKATRLYTEVTYQASDILVFGSETKGLPEEVLTQYPAQCVTIPMWGPVRSLNLSTAVGITLFEAYRQTRKK